MSTFRKSARLAMLCICLMAALPLAAEAQQNNVAFLKISGLPGESQIAAYNSHLELISYSYSLYKQSAVQKSYSSGQGAPNITRLGVSKWLGKASLDIQKLVLSGTVQKEAVLSVCNMQDGKLQPYMVLKMENVTLADYHTERLQEGGSRERFSLNFSKMTVQYIENGKLISSYSYDLADGGTIK